MFPGHKEAHRMKGLKKMAAVLACAAIAAGVFAGCGGDNKKDDKAAAGIRCSPFIRPAAKA